MRHTIRNDANHSVLSRVMLLLDSFEGSGVELSLAELTRRAGLAKPTVRRLVGQLEDQGLLIRTHGGIRLGLRLFELGSLVALHSTSDAVGPYLVDLHRRTGETVHFAVLQESEVTYVQKVAGRVGPVLPSRVGGRAPVHCTGLGKALVAYAPRATLDSVLGSRLRRYTPRTLVMPGQLGQNLEAVRARGVAFDHEEVVVGVSCAACPVFDEQGKAVAAISLTGPSTRFSTSKAAGILHETAEAIARELQVEHEAVPLSR
ncbi:IclR family transcriptional regulator [Rhodococcus koreensis]